MLFIAYGCHNKAVWNALKMHVEFVVNSGESVSFLVHQDSYNIVKKDYPEKEIFLYSNNLSLVYQLIRIKESKIFSPVMFTTLYGVLAKVLKSKEIYYWVQGSVPEESFLRNKSKLKYYILSLIEFLALSVADKKIFVSDEMQKHLELKYRKKYAHSIIVPCVSEFQYDGSTKEKDSFVYIGGISAWQRVDLMLEIFNDIKKTKPQAKLYIATLEKEKASSLIQQYLNEKHHKDVQLLSITDRKEIPKFLSTKEYGFLIRDNIIVNRVSSPIKLAEYLSCGVNVILSSAVKSYAPQIQEEKAGIELEEDHRLSFKLEAFTPNSVNAIKCYDKYFSKQQHTRNYANLLNISQKKVS